MTAPLDTDPGNINTTRHSLQLRAASNRRETAAIYQGVWADLNEPRKPSLLSYDTRRSFPSLAHRGVKKFEHGTRQIPELTGDRVEHQQTRRCGLEWSYSDSARDVKLYGDSSF